MLARMTSTEAKWAERVRDWRASGKSAELFAEGKQFEASTLRYWASRLKVAAERASSNSAEAAPLAQTSVAMARVSRRREPRAPQRGFGDAGIAIAIGGATIRVQHGFDPKLLREVVAALGGVS